MANWFEICKVMTTKRHGFSRLRCNNTSFRHRVTQGDKTSKKYHSFQETGFWQSSSDNGGEIYDSEQISLERGKTERDSHREWEGI